MRRTSGISLFWRDCRGHPGAVLQNGPTEQPSLLDDMLGTACFLWLNLLSLQLKCAPCRVCIGPIDGFHPALGTADPTANARRQGHLRRMLKCYAKHLPYIGAPNKKGWVFTCSCWLMDCFVIDLTNIAQDDGIIGES
jgi:hypothetical protein